MMPYQTMFLGRSRSRGVFGIGLSCLEHLVHGNKHGVCHRNDRRAAADARHKSLEASLKDGTILHGCRPCTFRQRGSEPLISLGAICAQ